ncbi:MAG: DUF4003 family protein [Planctomycetota bacterium]
MATFPDDPLARFLDLADGLVAEKSWWEDRTIVRYAALPLVTADGDAPALVRSAVQAAATLKEEAGWASDLRSTLRYVLAAFAIAEGGGVRGFVKACEALRTRFRDQGVRRGGVFERTAAAMLHVGGAGRDQDVARMQKIYETMKQHHWWLTGPEDLPACALLTVHGGDPDGMPQRIEAIYQRLRDGGLSAGDGLQMASHVLYLAPGSAAEATERFLQLHRGFLDQGIRMWDSDRDELAILCLLATDTQRTLRTVIDHRQRIRERLRHVGPTASFSFACGTAFLHALAGEPVDDALRRDLTVANLMMATNAATALAQQRAAAAASS